MKKEQSIKKFNVLKEEQLLEISGGDNWIQNLLKRITPNKALRS